MSGDRYFIKDQNAPYFLTLTIVDWIDVFTRKEHKLVIAESLNFCIKHKGLALYAWCLMSNHLQLVARAKENFKLSEIIRDFKKFTAKQILKLMEEGNESRKEWILDKMEFRGRPLKRITRYKFWKDGNHAIELDTTYLLEQKIRYTHENPVMAMIVEEPEHYLFSSARNYCSMQGLVQIEFP